MGVTEEDVIFLSIFWRDKEDVTRWTGWQDFAKRCPIEAEKILSAINYVEYAKEKVKRVINNLAPK